MTMIQTDIKQVQIYRQGAEITRNGKADLQEGQNTLHICGLSTQSDFDSARLYFPAGIQLTDIRFFYQDDDEETESDQIREEINERKQNIELCELQINLWKENGNFSGRSEQNIQEIQKYITSLPGQISLLQKKIILEKKEVKRLEKKLNEVLRKEQQPVICAEILSDKAGTYPFELTYHDNAASWMPVYELHTNAKDPMTLKVRARIFQNTAEDWKDIKVSLFTGNPSVQSDLPVLDPVYLSFSRPEPKRRTLSSAMAGGRNMAKAAMPMMAMEDTAVEETAELDMMEMPTAEINTSETMTEYVLPGTKDIPADTEGTMADLQKYEIPCEYRITAFPKLNPRAFLTADFKSADLPAMVSGKISIYLDDTYVGSTSIKSDRDKDTLSISLGKEEAIHVSRTEKKKKTTEALLKNQKTTEYTYELSVINNKDQEVKVTVYDQMPVSQDKSIVTEVINNDHAGVDDRGILTWNITVPAGQSRTLVNAYKVSWPKDKTIFETKNSNRFCPVCGSKVYGSFCPECGTRVE